jgi:hypothetical protein
MPNIEDKLKLAARITALRAELAQLEADFAGPSIPKPRVTGGPVGKGPSISQRVLHIVRDAGAVGVSRRDILATVGADHESAVHSALRTHSSAGRVHSDGGQWVLTAATRPTRELRVPTEAFADQ